MKTVILSVPLNIGFLGRTTVSAVDVRAPKVKDLVGLNFSPEHINDSNVILCSRLTGLVMKDLLEMNLRDYYKICEVVAEYLGNATKKGGGQ